MKKYKYSFSKSVADKKEKINSSYRQFEMVALKSITSINKEVEDLKEKLSAGKESIKKYREETKKLMIDFKVTGNKTVKTKIKKSNTALEKEKKQNGYIADAIHDLKEQKSTISLDIQEVRKLEKAIIKLQKEWEKKKKAKAKATSKPTKKKTINKAKVGKLTKKDISKYSTDNLTINEA